MDIPEAAQTSESADAVFRSWERFRIGYNLVLGLVLIPLAWDLIDDQTFPLFVAECAVGANLCFCTGPVVEGYLALLGFPRKLSRFGLVGCGTLLSMSLEVLAVMYFRNPDQFKAI